MQTGTLRHITALALVLQLACSDDDPKQRNEMQAGDARTAFPPITCSVHSDCVLVPTQCCACPPATLANVRVVHRDDAETTRCAGIDCAACAELDYDPLAAQPRAACVANRCTVIDLRKDEASRCTQNSECRTESAGCCPACSSNPALHVSLNTQTDRSLLACFPVPPCEPCLGTPPSSFCAPDGHCAVRK